METLVLSGPQERTSLSDPKTLKIKYQVKTQGYGRRTAVEDSRQGLEEEERIDHLFYWLISNQDSAKNKDNKPSQKGPMLQTEELRERAKTRAVYR